MFVVGFGWWFVDFGGIGGGLLIVYVWVVWCVDLVYFVGCVVGISIGVCVWWVVGVVVVLVWCVLG